MKVSELGEIKNNNKKGRTDKPSNKPSKKDRARIKQLRKFKRNNS